MKVLSDKNSLCLLFASSCLVLFLHIPSIPTLLFARIHHQSWLTIARESPLTLLEVLYRGWPCLFYISESRLSNEWRILSALTVFMSTKRRPLLAIVGVISSGRRLSNNDLVTYRLLHISSSDIDEKRLLWEWIIFFGHITRRQSLPGSVRVGRKKVKPRFEVPFSQRVRASTETSQESGNWEYLYAIRIFSILFCRNRKIVSRV